MWSLGRREIRWSRILTLRKVLSGEKAEQKLSQSSLMLITHQWSHFVQTLVALLHIKM